MLAQMASHWTYATVKELIDGREPLASYAEVTAAFIADKPHLWIVSDEEFIAGVRALKPACADLLATPEGIEFLHKMSRAVALRSALIRVKGVFGG